MFRLDPCPQWTLAVGELFSNPRLIIFTVIISKICIDRVYSMAKIINPNAERDADGEVMLDILEYNHPQTAADVYGYLDSYGPKGRMAYEAMLKYDCGFVLARTVPLCLVIYWAFNKAPAWLRPGIWLPLASMAVDLSENLGVWILLKTYPRRMLSLAQATTWLMSAKWILLWAVVGVLTVGLLVGIYYSFHSMLSDSVLMEKDKREKINKTKRQVTETLQRQHAGNASKKKQ